MEQKVTLQQLAEKLKGEYWEKGNLKRVYLYKGNNTEKMTTKTFIWEDDGEFKVSCRISCSSQPYEWIKSQQKEIVEKVLNDIQDVTTTEYYFAKHNESGLYYRCGVLVDFEKVVDSELYSTKEKLLKEMDNCGDVPEQFEFVVISKDEVKSEIEKIEGKGERLTLSVNNVSDFIGRKIEWNAPGYIANGDYGGVCIIKSVDFNKRKPLTTETISGDDLSFAFLDTTMQGNLLCDAFCYSDGGRYVTFVFADEDTNSKG